MKQIQLTPAQQQAPAQDLAKKPYTQPVITQVELMAEEAVLGPGQCKTASGINGPIGDPCYNGNCKN